MKSLSAKHLKKTTRTLYNFSGTRPQASETTHEGTDPTNTTLTIVTTTHLLKN